MSRQQGLTIVELMVSVLLAGMLASGLFYMMSGQQVTYSSQISQTITQQNLAGTMSYLQRWVRSAGYGFGACPAFGSSGVGRVHMRASDTSAMPSPVVAIEHFNGCNLYLRGPADPACAAGTDGVDSLKITRVHPSSMVTASLPSAIMFERMQNNSDPIQVPTTTNFPVLFQKTDPPELAVLWDPSGGPCILLAVTDLSTVGCGTKQCVSLVHDTDGVYNGGDWWVPAPVSKSTGFAGSNNGGATRVARLSPESYPRIFAIDPATRRLMTWQSMKANPRDDIVTSNGTLEVVAEQIEDMQIATACDALGGGNGNLDEGTSGGARQSDEWAFNVPGDTPPACGAMPIGAVRVTLIARAESATVGGPAVGARPAAEDRLKGPVDRYSRSVLTSTIKTINLR